MNWLNVHRGAAPLIVAFPHTGTDIPDDCAAGLVSPWLVRKDADWRIEQLYDFAASLGATTIHTAISRTVIDVNRDPSGASLYPGQTTTELCPTTTFDGEPLYAEGAGPDAESIAARRGQFFAPYHRAIAAEIARLRQSHANVVLYDAHAIRSRVPRLFDGLLPHFNIGANNGTTCGPALVRAVQEASAAAGDFSYVCDGRFKGGYTTRHYGRPSEGVHALQMELAFRTFIDEPDDVTDSNWPPTFDTARAAPTRAVLKQVLESCLTFAERLSAQ